MVEISLPCHCKSPFPLVIPNAFPAVIPNAGRNLQLEKRRDGVINSKRFLVAALLAMTGRGALRNDREEALPAMTNECRHQASLTNGCCKKLSTFTG